MANATFSCMNCGSDRCTMVYADCPDYYLEKPFRVDYVACDGCGLVQQSPLPTDTSRFYDAYPVHQEKSFLYRFARRLTVSKAYFDARALPAGTVLLDYGCGDGWYLESLKGRSLTLLGFEPDADHATNLSDRLGLRVYWDDDALVSERAGTVDILTMHFVVEHVTDLHHVFDVAASLLKPGGIMYCLIPNVASAEARLFRKKWHGLDPPRHVSFPGPAVVKHLASVHGLRLAAQRAVPFPNTTAGSVPAVVCGRFVQPLFVASLPPAIVLSRLDPSGSIAFHLTKE